MTESVLGCDIHAYPLLLYPGQRVLTQVYKVELSHT